MKSAFWVDTKCKYLEKDFPDAEEPKKRQAREPEPVIDIEIKEGTAEENPELKRRHEKYKKRLEKQQNKHMAKIKARRIKQMLKLALQKHLRRQKKRDISRKEMHLQFS
jgi:hypothetical protein